MQDTENRLHNWARWAKVRPKYSTCRSLEHKYKSPQTWHAEEPRVEVNILDAVVIEKALVHPSFPRRYRELIKYVYLYPGINPMKICRKLGIRNGDIDAEVRYAILMLENRLKSDLNCSKKLLTLNKIARIKALTI